MKTAVTIELDDDQLVAVGFIQHGKFQRAKQTDVREFVRDTVMITINAAAGVVHANQLKTADLIKDKLGIEAAAPQIDADTE